MFREWVQLFVMSAMTLWLCGCSRNTMLSAAEKGDVETVKRLLAKDPSLANASEYLAQGRPAIRLAAENGHAAIVKLLLEAGANTNYSHLMELAASNGHVPVMEVLFEKGLPVHGDMLGSPLLTATARGQLQAAEFLLNRGVNVNEQDERRNDGCAALHYAALHGKSTMVATLLAHGADVELPDNGGGTPLLYAAAGGDAKTAEVLLVNGAKVNARSKRGMTPLMRAVANGNLAVLPVLLAHGADVNARDEDGDTALTIAVKACYNPHAFPDINRANENKCLQLVNFLLAHKAEATAQNKDNETALTLAQKQNWRTVASALREAAEAANRMVSP